MSDELSRLKTALADRYTILQQIGAGGMATVYLAEDLRHARKVAVKVLRPDLASALGPERFVREIRIAAQLTHPHILTLIDSGEAGGFLFYVMPFIEGESLRNRLAERGEAPIDEAVRILRDVADALAHAHARGVVHRDIKPDNVLMSGRHALVTDFGVAKAVSEATGRQELTTAGVALGTPAYMAPEQAAADPHIDHRADVYAVGVLGYELLTGRAPFSGGTPQQTLASHLTEAPEPVTKHRAAVSPALAETVMRCLEKKPADRWQTVEELRDRLESLAAPSGGTQPVTTVASGARRPPGWVFAVLAVLVAVAAGGLLFRNGGTPHATPLSAQRVAVFPFSVRGVPDELSYLGEGLVELLSTAIDGAGTLRTVDPNAVLRAAPAGETWVLDPEAAESVSRSFGAGRFVIGSVTGAGGARVQVRASLFEIDGAQPVVAQATGDASATLELVQDLARQLLVAYAGAAVGRADSLALLTTDSLEALKAYVAANRAYREGDYGSAVAEFQRAVAIDTAFALAHYRLSRAASWAELQEVGEAAAERALALSGRLSERHRLLLEAAAAFEGGRPLAAEEATLAIVRSYPSDAEAWYLLGEARMHGAQLLRRPGSLAREAFERAMALDPGRGDAFSHAYDLALAARDVVALDTLIRAAYPESTETLHGRLVRALAEGDSAVMDSVIADLPTTPFHRSYWIARISWWWGDLQAGERATRLLAEPGRSSQWQAFGQLSLAFHRVAGGRRAAADEAVAAATVLDRATGLEYAGLFAALGVPPRTDDDLRRVRDSLEAWDASAVPPCANPEPFLCVHDGVHPQVRLYLLGLLSARLGERSEALARADQLAALGGSPEAQALAGDLVRGIRALLRLEDGDPAAAVAELQQTSVERDIVAARDSPFFGLVFERYLEAEALHQLGRYRDAIVQFEANGHLVLQPVSHLRRAEAYEQLGDTARAVEHSQRFLEYWREPDSEYRPIVEDVRQRVARLIGE